MATLLDCYGRYHVVLLGSVVLSPGAELHGPQPTLGAHFLASADGRKVYRVCFVLVHCGREVALQRHLQGLPPPSALPSTGAGRPAGSTAAVIRFPGAAGSDAVTPTIAEPAAPTAAAGRGAPLRAAWRLVWRR